MRNALLVSFGLFVSVASADSISTSVRTGNWTIETSEDLWAGGRHTSYPIWNMLDGRPDTAWVFSGLAYPKLSDKEKDLGLSAKLSLRLIPTRPVVIDELRLMNGYNKSEALYYRNSRVTEIAIYDGYPEEYVNDGWVPRKPVRKLRLSDAAGMKSIALPKRKYKELWIEITDVKKGVVDDLCLSELMPRLGGVDLIPRGQAIQYSVGSDCGCSDTGAVYGPTGRKIVDFDHSERPVEVWSPDRKTLAVLDRNQNLVFIDAATSRILRRYAVLPDQSEGNCVNVTEWVDNRTVKVYSTYKHRSKEQNIRVR